MRTLQGINDASPSGTAKMAGRLGGYFSGRRGLLVLGGIAATLGIGLNWTWLAAAGITPILVGLLPCAAMCALGQCLPRLMRAPADEQAASHDMPLSDVSASSGDQPPPISASAHADRYAPATARPCKDCE
jgi:hypothetical protein